MIPDLESYDVIEMSSSGGKDSQAMKVYVASLLRARGLLRRGIVVHADLGRVEWPGSPYVVWAQANALGLPFMKVSREQGDLLEHVEAYGRWPMPTERYCTSDHKRGQIYRAFTHLAELVRAERPDDKRPVKILNCIGLRAEESPGRKKRPPLLLRDRKPTGKGTVKIVDVWLPIQSWTEADVWTVCSMSGLPIHPAYAFGFPRASCRFCIYMTKPAALLRAGELFPDLLAEYVRIERKVDHEFVHHLPLAKIQDDLARGVRATGPIESWCM